MAFDFHKGDFTIRQEYKTVWHSIVAGACKLGRDTPHRLDRLDEFPLYGFLSHVDLRFWLAQLAQLAHFSYIAYARVLRMPVSLSTI